MDRISLKPSVSVRENYVDIIKGFAIIAVVLLHINFAFPKYALINTGSILGGQWHVAVFFLVSGFFIKDDKLASPISFMKPKFWNLYIKALYVYIPLVLLHNVFLRWGWLYTDILYNHKYLSEFEGLDWILHIVSQFLFFSREPLSGAMWYVDSLLIAMGIYTVLYWLVSKSNRLNNSRQKIIGCIILVLATISGIATNVFGITLPKCSNVFTGLLLIYVGKNSYKLLSTGGGKKTLCSFENGLVLFVCVIIFYQYNLFDGGMALNSNRFHDMVHLVVCSWSAMYILAFIGKKIQRSSAGKIIAYIGKESFWIMGLHMIGFHVFTTILNFFGMEFEHHFTTPNIDTNITLLIGYLFFGIGIPLLIKFTFKIRWSRHLHFREM